MNDMHEMHEMRSYRRHDASRMTRVGDATPSMVTHVLVSGASVMCATSVTHPIDVVKVRAQTGRERGLASSARALYGESGVAFAVRGLGPALVRAGAYGGVRLGAYEPLLRATGRRDGRDAGVVAKAVSGAVSGALASVVLNPMELLKTRMQRDGKGLREHLERVAREGGARTLWRGSSVAVARSATLTATQVATYGESKQRVIASGLASEGVGLHFAVAMLTGVVTTATTNPVDVVKTLVYVADGGSTTARVRPTILGTVRDVLREHGPLGFWRGFSANYLRLGPQTVVTFVAAEFLRERFGLAAF